jgi:hypothetical protein
MKPVPEKGRDATREGSHPRPHTARNSWQACCSPGLSHRTAKSVSADGGSRDGLNATLGALAFGILAKQGRFVERLCCARSSSSRRVTAPVAFQEAGDILRCGCRQHPSERCECGTPESPRSERSERVGTEGAARPCSMPRGSKRARFPVRSRRGQGGVSA